MPNRSKRRKSTKLDKKGKTMISVVSLAALLGGWNAIGHREASAGESTPVATPATAPAVQIRPLSTLPPVAANVEALAVNPVAGGMSQPASGLDRVPTIPALAPLPAMAPLPALPPMPTASSSGGGRSHKTGGSK